MIFWGHIGSSLFASLRLGKKPLGWNQATALAVCAMLPDLVDKPLYYLGLTPIPSGRVWGHTLLFSLAWLLLCRFWLRPFWPWAWAAPGHLLLDSMWGSPHTLFWPLLGNVFDPPERLFGNHWEQWVWLYRNEPWSAAWLLGAEMAGLLLAARVLLPRPTPRPAKALVGASSAQTPP